VKLESKQAALTRVPRWRWLTSLRRNAALASFIVLCLVFTLIIPWRDGFPVFLSQVNILNVIRQVSVVGIMAVGMTYVILLGQIDLGVGSVLALTGMVAAIMQRAELGLVPSLLVPILIGAATGLLVGWLVTQGNIPSFVATLGILAAYRGATLLISGQPVLGLQDDFRFIGAGEILGIPVPIFLFAIVVTIGALVLRRTRFGRYIYAVGGNETAARLSGINVSAIKLSVFVITGVCTAISALILTGRLNSGQPLAGQGYELDVIASVVVGGTSLAGGRGSVGGSLIGAMLIGVLSNGLTLLEVPPDWQPIVKGSIIVMAVLIDNLGRKRAA
jgi:ribose/xylose/arabinose/galactoside ABC-type transport system permease subunit